MLLFFCISFIATAQNKHVPFDPKKQLSQFLIDVWDSEKGLPSSTLLQAIQTKDGYLWIGSYDGLLRFDGNSFDLYTKNTVEQFKTNNITQLSEAKDSTLWIGTQGSGLLSYKNGVFKSHGLEGDYIESIHILDTNDSVYVGTRSSGLFIYDIKKDNFTPIFTKELASESIYDILEYPRGKFWLATQNQGIIILENNQILNAPCEIENPHTLKLYLDTQKRVWAGTYNGIFRYENNRFVRQFEELAKERIHDMQFDPAGNFWIVTRNNIYRKNILTNQLELLTTETGASFDDVRSIWLDQEEDLWIPTARHGLCRLRDGKFINYTVREGLAYPSVNSIGVYNKTEVLVGTSNGTIHRINSKQNKVFDYPIKSNLSNREIFNIRQDSAATVWISTYNGLLKKELNGNEKLFTKKDGLPTNTLRLSYQDSKGRFWIGTRGEGLVEYKKDLKTDTYIFKKIGFEKGFTANFVMSITEDNDGNLLVGTNNEGLAIENGNKFELFTTENGLPTNLIFNIHCDKQNIIWLATNAGLVRWKDKKAFTFDDTNNFPNETIFDIVEDDKGYFWFSSNRGILRVNKNDLNSLANGEDIDINWTQYDKDDGMRSEQCKGATQSLISPQGIIWIPTNNGALHINPDFLPINSRRPPVYIQKVFLDDEVFLEPLKVTLKPDQQRLIIDFTALSFRAPEKVKFKYKLEGFDKDWVITKDNKREAVYTNIPNGTYTFQVIAANNDGIWNNEGASLEIEVKPHVYETPWFIGAIFLLVGGGIWGVVAGRTKRIKIKAAELERIVKLRTTELRSSNEELITQQQVVDERNQIIEKQNHNIISSINYAKRIQVAMLPTLESVEELLPNSFILFLPRDIVSGDFYWIEQQSEKIVVATVDCTGHGVPGAFMSLIGNDMLNKVIIDYSITKPNLILDVLNQEISNILKQRETDNRDGMDMNIWTWNQKTRIVEFAGAKNPLIYIQNGELHEIKADKISIGGNYYDKEGIKYTNHTIKIDSPTVLYTFSDGYQDQFGGEKDKKFMKGKLKKLLLEIHELPMKEQNKILKDTFESWKKDFPQVDDVLIIGVKIDVDI
ncbi:putative periplasmic ligand-binding sensor domain protein [Bernardetia litoralis DSM 6794]|uniref:Putative periplasmic ligand-binding sensor domain protein n=1 Tax=Bernardetia litoralis (strain ATCC 23117 / DSM 6794 / NBRC 15988 / NCIMB 1366 / Fx l1 / Sio-4) TaxID=880071 RepID=I4AGA0_BERLS|nr:two-component regulator propeller domain-containing protein [Bernardetia litoralis]AFM02985.1 putative periplasmic ligand-binding sensor domain protein [Bernardetia litoralis DSM 6794]